MSLHKFAEQVAANGRGDDSLLVHMTPDEVQRLQKFAEANGRTMTINPHTGLPEAGFLSDLFKAVAPIALGAFLGPAGMGISFGGLSSAVSAGLATGGITALATGSLSRGLMAGLGAYGGAGLGESFMNAGAASIGSAAEGIQGPIGSPESGFGATQAIAAAPKADVLSAGFNAATANPTAMGTFAKQNLGNLAYAAAPLMAVQPTTKMPEPKSTGYIRQYDYNINPDTGKPDPLYGMRAMTPVKASEFGNKTFEGQRELFRQQNPNPYELGVGSLNQPPKPMATGGIVALADGGPTVSDQQIFDYFAAGPKSDEQIARDMGTYNVSAADIARATGTQDRAAEYQNRYTVADTKNDIYDYFAKPETQTLLKSGNDAAIAQALQNNDWTLANVAAATGTQGQLGDYGTRYVNAVSDKNTDASEFLARAADVGLTGANLATALQNSGMSAADQYALTHNLADTGGITGTNFYNQLGYTKGALPGDMGGLEGLYANINYSATGLQKLIDSGKMTVAQAQDAALAEANRVGVSLKDIAAATGKTIGTLFTPKPPTKIIDKFTDTITGGTGNDTVLPDAFTSVVPGGTKLSTATTYDNGAFGNYGSGNKTGVDYLGRTVSIATPGDIITNPDYTRTVVPNIPGRPYGGFTGMDQVKSAYTAGGGSLGYTAKAPKTIDEFNQLYNKQTGDSLAAYDYLMGKGAGKYPVKSVAPNIAMPYNEYVLGKKTAKPVAKTTTTEKKETTAANTATLGGVTYDLTNRNVPPPGDSNGDWQWSDAYNRWVQIAIAADGGLMGYSVGGGLGSLGSYSDGGRLLKGPGDGVSDSIPATIGAKNQPARLADGEFVVPARIVSELGNGSTDAGAKKLYAMMDRVQRARGKTTGKNKVAANTGADKYLPA